MNTLCINLAHPRFTHLQRQTGLPEPFLAAKIAAWAEENDSNIIPTAQELGLQVMYDSEMYPYNEDLDQLKYVDSSEVDTEDGTFFYTELVSPKNLLNADQTSGVGDTISISKLNAIKEYLKEEDYRLKSPSPSWITDPTTVIGKMLDEIDIPIIKDTIAYLRNQNKNIQQLKSNANLITNDLYRQAGIDPVKLLEDESTQLENIQRVQQGEERLPTPELDKLNNLKVSNRSLYEQIEDLGDKQFQLIRQSSNAFEKEVKKFFNSLMEYEQKELGLTTTSQDKTSAIKPGVPELFDSNPELANAVYEALGFNQMITPNDKVVFGHPTIGKSYLKKQGEGRFITLDDDYKDEVNAFIDANRGTETRQEYKGRKPKEYNEFMLNLYDRLKAQAQKEGKILFVSNTNILKERMSDFDKVITIPKEEFKRRFDERGATYGFEDWKSDIDATVAKVPSNKVITTTGYLADLFITPKQKQQAQQLYSQYLDSIFPESKVKDILKHTTSATIDIFKKGNGRLGEGIYFAAPDYKMYDKAGINVYRVIVNINNLKRYDKGDFVGVSNDLFPSEDEYSSAPQKSLQAQDKLEGIDGYVSTAKTGTEYNIFEPEQIHILGNKQDVEGFKEFMSQEQKPQKETLFQLSSQQTEPSNDEINKKVIKFLEKIGVNVRSVDRIRNIDGKPLSAIAKADMLNKVIEVVNDRAAIDTLPEEAAHFFVELLGPGNPIYKDMFNKITGYKIYSQVVAEYKDLKEYRNQDGTVNFDKLKKEAIGKVIAEHIIKGYRLDETDQKLSVIAKTWKRLMDFLKNIFGNITKEDNPFATAADKIMAGDISEFQLDNPGDGIYYSYADPVEGILQAQQDITLDNTLDESTGQKRHVYYYKGIASKGSVTSYYVDPWLKKIFRSDQRTEAQKLIDITKADYGDVIHEQISEIIKSWTNKDGSKRQEQKPITPITSGSIYRTLNNYVQDLMAQYDDGTKFLSEVKIFDQKKRIGGSIDLLIIQPTGVVDIFDWKSQEIFKGQDDIKPYKETMYRIQLEEYRKILQKEFGFENFGQIRAIPIRTMFLYRDGQIQDIRNIEIGSIDIDEIPEEKSYLLPVALKNESTGDKELDKLLTKLNALFEKLQKTRPTKDEIFKKREEIAQFRLAIRDLQLRGRIDRMVSLGLAQHKKYSEKLKEGNLTGKELLESLKLLEVFASSRNLLFNLREQELQVLKESKDQKSIEAFERLNKRYLTMTANVDKLIEDIKEYRDSKVEQMADQYGIPGALEPEAVLSALPATFQSLSNIDRKLFRLFSKNLRLAQNRREVKFDKTVKKLQQLKNNFTKWASEKGLSTNQALESLLNIDDKGNWNGNFLSKYKKEFYQERENAIKTGNGKWILDNTDWDPENKYAAEEKKQLEVFKSLVYDADDKVNAEIIDSKMKDWIMEHKLYGKDGKVNMKALMNPKNKFLKPKSEWFTDKYKELYSKDGSGNYINKPAVEVYEYMQSLVRYSENLGMLDQYSPGFIPSMLANNLENFSFGKTSGVFNKNFMENLQVDSGTYYTPEIDPTDGSIINRIPVYFTKDVGVKREDGTWDYTKKSRDLFKVFGVWSAHMYNYEAMKDIEDASLMILEAERNKGSLVTDATGKVVIENNQVKASDQNDKNALLLEEFINYYIYDRQGGVIADKTFSNPFSRKNEDEKTKYSVAKTVQGAVNYFGIKTLGLNLISASAQFVGGTGNVLFQALKGQQFTTKTWMQAVYLATSSSKARKALEYMNIAEGTGKEGMINDLSLSTGTKYINKHNMFILQRMADKTVTQPIALAMMLEHMLDEDGNIVSIQKYVKNKYKYNETFYNLPSSERAIIKQKMEEEVAELKEKKSLLAIGVVDEKTGEFSIPGLSRESDTYSAFKDKINGTIKKAIGNTGRDDINSLRTGMLGTALSQFRSWIPEMVEDRLGGLKYDDELDQWTYGRFNTFFGELFSFRFGRLAKALITGLGDNAIQMAKEKYIEMKAEAYEANKEFNITEAEFIDIYIGNLRAMMGELVALLAIGGAVLLITSGGDDEKKSGVKKYLSRALKKYWNEFSFYFNPFEFQKLLKSPLPAVGLLEDFYRFSGSTFKELAGVAVGNEDWVEEAKPMKNFLRSVPVGKEFLLLAAALDDDFRKEWDIKLDNYFY